MKDEQALAAGPAGGRRGVSPIIITSNDLGGRLGRFVPTARRCCRWFQASRSRREFAFRAGVNIVM